MFMSLTIVRYPGWAVPLAFISMAVFRLPLLFTRGLTFWKLLGCGKNGTFDIEPDLKQWGLLAVWETEADFENFRQHSFLQRWWKTLCHEQWTILCQPCEAHGKWDGKEPFSKSVVSKDYQGKIAVLTRASIRPSKLRGFWANVPPVAAGIKEAAGFVTSVGVGEMPFVRQATFSIWESLNDVKQFAYKQRTHADVVRKTRDEGWYSEELFARFIPLKTFGSLNGQRYPL
ncbi:DUF3291 domain-containing protein [Emticicia sp. TH156]|nr:DUF3291 domain-containing protein [Emticicia sp. TH156]